MNTDLHVENKELDTEWLALNKLLTKRNVFQATVNSKALEDIEEINSELSGDVPFLLNVFLNDTESINKAASVKATGSGNFHIQLRIWAFEDIDIDAFKYMLDTHRDRFDVIIYFIRFNTDMDMEEQFDKFEVILSCLENIKETKIVYANRLSGNEICSLESGRRLMECVTRVYEEGFNVVKFELELDSNIGELEEDWYSVSKAVGGTTHGSITLRKYEDTVNLSVPCIALKQLWSDDCFITIGNSVGTNFIYSGLQAVEFQILSEAQGLYILSPKQAHLLVQFTFDSIQIFLDSVGNERTLKTLKFSRFNSSDQNVYFPDHEKLTLYVTLRNILSRYQNVSYISISGTELKDGDDEAKQIHESFLKDRQTNQ